MKLKLGHIYIVQVELPTGFTLLSWCKLIKVTKTGYNMLNLKTDKCIFKHHLYPMKGKNMEFFVHRSVRIQGL